MAPVPNTLIVVCLALAACRSPQPPTVRVVGLWPEAPALSYKPYNAWTGGNYFVWPVVSAHPTLVWETFPRPGEIASDITAVTYDLCIWQNAGEFPGELVYRRDALPNATHRVEQALPRGREYFWSVRARFQYRGQPRVTEWSHILWPDSRRPARLVEESSTFPDGRAYRFRVR